MVSLRGAPVAARLRRLATQPVAGTSVTCVSHGTAMPFQDLTPVLALIAFLVISCSS